jgi:molybdenum cofactor guanylyltransferase
MSSSPGQANVVGVLLAGGQSRRMGGGHKGLLDICGKPMLAHVIERIRPQVGPLVINTNSDPSQFAQFDLPVVADSIEGFVGPLGGVLAGMRWARTSAPEAPWIATVSTDAPLIPHDLVGRLLLAVAGRDKAIALASSGGELHPVIGLWPVALADDLEAALRAGDRKVLRWTDRHGSVPVEFPFFEIRGRKVDPFFNANTPEELAEARAVLEP